MTGNISGLPVVALEAAVTARTFIGRFSTVQLSNMPLLLDPSKNKMEHTLNKEQYFTAGASAP
jgi:hypothetical protein